MTVLEIVGNLVPNPPVRTLLVLGYPDVYQAGDHIPEILPYKPIACEGFNDRLLEDYKKKGLHLKEIKLMPAGKGWLILEFGGQAKQDANDQASALMEHLKKQKNAPSMELYDDQPHEHQIWEVRESALGGSSFVPGKKPTWPGWEDSAVPPDEGGFYLRNLDALFNKYGWYPSIFGHFGQGCIHIRVPFELTISAMPVGQFFFSNSAMPLSSARRFPRPGKACSAECWKSFRQRCSRFGLISHARATSAIEALASNPRSTAILNSLVNFLRDNPMTLILPLMNFEP